MKNSPSPGMHRRDRSFLNTLPQQFFLSYGFGRSFASLVQQLINCDAAAAQLISQDLQAKVAAENLPVDCLRHGEASPLLRLELFAILREKLAEVSQLHVDIVFCPLRSNDEAQHYLEVPLSGANTIHLKNIKERKHRELFKVTKKNPRSGDKVIALSQQLEQRQKEQLLANYCYPQRTADQEQTVLISFVQATHGAKEFIPVILMRDNQSGLYFFEIEEGSYSAGNAVSVRYQFDLLRGNSTLNNPTINGEVAEEFKGRHYQLQPWFISLRGSMQQAFSQRVALSRQSSIIPMGAVQSLEDDGSFKVTEAEKSGAPVADEAVAIEVSNVDEAQIDMPSEVEIDSVQMVTEAPKPKPRLYACSYMWQRMPSGTLRTMMGMLGNFTMYYTGAPFAIKVLLMPVAQGLISALQKSGARRVFEGEINEAGEFHLSQRVIAEATENNTQDSLKKVVKAACNGAGVVFSSSVNYLSEDVAPIATLFTPIFQTVSEAMLASSEMDNEQNKPRLSIQAK